MWNCGYRGPTVKLYTDFKLHGGSSTPNPHIVEGSTVDRSKEKSNMMEGRRQAIE